MIGRYGGCFEEDIRRFMCERAYHITGLGCIGEVCTNSQCEKGQCTVPKRLANGRKVKVRIIHGLNISQKNSYTYCKNLEAIKKFKYYAHAPRGIDWQEKTIARPRPPLIRMHKPGTLHVSNLLHNFNHTCILRDLLTSTQVFLKFTTTQLARL